MQAPLIEMRNITKIYPDGVKALDNVNFTLYPGEVHALLGENGAGKTTLMRILYGEVQPTKGEIIVDGERIPGFKGTWEAITRGIAMVYQQLRLIPTLTVEDNIRLYLDNVSRLRRKKINVKEAILNGISMSGFDIPLQDIVENIPLGVRQRVEIVKALSGGARVLILDEPTSNLTPLEARALFNSIKRLKKHGVSVVYITHKLWEVFEIADRITVMRQGRVVASLPADKAVEEELAALMIGDREVLSSRGARRKRNTGDTVLSVDDVWVRNNDGIVKVKGVRFTVRSGEIVGIAGVAGNGQEELVEAIIGLRRPSKGSIMILGEQVRNTKEFYLKGGGLIAGDRRLGLALDMSIAENIAMLYYSHTKSILLSWSNVKKLFESLRKDLKLAASNMHTRIGNLSGGNQQKVLVGVEIATNPKLVVAVNPTQGLDIATTRQVRNILDDMASKGAAVLLVSSDIDEILELSDRILVMSNGRITGELSRANVTPEKLGALMAI